jgi:G3E family GTPase
MIPLFLITGFLGSGKTTWLKQIAREHKDRRFIYLVNDFASVDVDGELVRQAGDYVMAVSGGSIFCKCLVTEFIGALTAIAEKRAGMDTHPEAVLIEASGMADPRVIHTMLHETGLNRIFNVARIIALADPGTLHKLLKTLPNIRAQLECADSVLISKADLYPTDVIESTRALIHSIQPKAACHTVIHGQTDLTLFEEAQPPTTTGEYALCKDPNFHRFTITERVPSLTEFQDRANATQDHLYRAKGFVADHNGAVYAVDWSSSGFTATPWHGDPPALRVVCIASGQHGEAVESIWLSAHNNDCGETGPDGRWPRHTLYHTPR